jgi:hypothetical protein
MLKVENLTLVLQKTTEDVDSYLERLYLKQ